MFNIGLESLDMYRILTMYHVTRYENYNSIKRQGLLTSYKKHYATGMYKTIYPGVYLSNDKKYSLGVIFNRTVGKDGRVLLLTCEIMQKHMHIDEDIILDYIVSDIPTMIFKNTYVPKPSDSTYIKTINSTKEYIMLLDDNRLESLRIELNSLFKGLLPRSPIEQINTIKELVYFFIWDNLKLPNQISRNILKEHELRHTIPSNIPEDMIEDLLRVLPRSMYQWLSSYRAHMFTLVKNSNNCLEQFIELRNHYKNNPLNKFINTPKCFVTPNNIDFKSQSSRIVRMDKYINIDGVASFEKTLYP